MLPDGVLAVIKDPAQWVQGLQGSLLASPGQRHSMRKGMLLKCLAEAPVCPLLSCVTDVHFYGHMGAIIPSTSGWVTAHTWHDGSTSAMHMQI